MKLVIFFVVSTFVAFLSWDSIKDRRSHGFPRFFAFESILILFLLNVDVWFVESFSPHQVISWLLLFGSIPLALHGFYMLRAVGRPKDKWENTTSLITSGAYRYIRHPMYCSLLLVGWGVFFKEPTLVGGALAVANSGFLIVTAKRDENEMLEKFGDEYADYMAKTKLFIPFLF